MAYSFGEVIGQVKKYLNSKKKKKLLRLISNVGRATSSRVLFKTLNILPLPRMYIMEIVHYIKMNINGLEQNSVRHNYNTHHRSDLQSQFCRTEIIKKKVICHMSIYLGKCKFL